MLPFLNLYANTLDQVKTVICIVSEIRVLNAFQDGYVRLNFRYDRSSISSK